MNLLSLLLILISLVTFVAGQLLLKRAMEFNAAVDFRRYRLVRFFLPGTFLMAISFFLTLGLLQRFDLSYLYPFQGLSVIFISAAAAILLHERLTPPLIAGSILIAAGVVLVSIS